MAKELSNVEQGFKDVQNIISFHKERVYQVINTEIVITNWEVGRFVSNKIKTDGWGKRVVDGLVDFLKEVEPNLKGYNRRTIYRMVQFYETYSSIEFVSALLTQLENEKNVLSYLTLINWSSHIEILSGCKLEEERLFYILLSQKDKLTYRELRRQIETSVYERTVKGESLQSKALKEIYPTAKQLFKDSYMVDFLNLPESHNEESLHKGLIAEMKSFILDLGRDFLFVSSEHRLQVGMSDYKLDLLFYHRELRCLVAIELKTTKFKLEYIGQLEFYLEALDKDVKKDNENPSIGILLCKSADSEVVKYSLSRAISPTSVAEYHQKLIPKEVLRKYLREFYDNIEEE